MRGAPALGTVSVEEIGSTIRTPKLFQLYFHKDRGLTNSMIERCIAANFDVLALTVDTITGGNRERDLRTGFTSPPRLTLKSLLSFAMHPRWAANYFMREKFELPQLKDYVKEGSSISVSIGDYFSTMLDESMNWQDAEDVRKKWGKQFCLKGIMSVADAKRAVDIGATGIMVSNHGGRQLDGSRSPFDQLAEIVDAVGDRIDVICDGGVTRGTHVLKALSLGVKACSGGRFYLYALAGGGQAGVERALGNLRAEIERDMKLMGCQGIQVKSASGTRFRTEREGLQDVGAAGDAAVANHIYSVADSIDDLGELVERAPRPVERRPPWLDTMTPLAPMSTARLASATLMMPLRQNCFPHFFRTLSASRQFIDWSSIVLK